MECGTSVGAGGGRVPQRAGGFLSVYELRVLGTEETRSGLLCYIKCKVAFTNDCCLFTYIIFVINSYSYSYSYSYALMVNLNSHLCCKSLKGAAAQW